MGTSIGQIIIIVLISILIFGDIPKLLKHLNLKLDKSKSSKQKKQQDLD